MRFFAVFAALLLGYSHALALPGDVKWAAVETNGWVAQICVESAPTNASFNFGWGTNNSGAGKVQLVINSPGFETNGSPVFRTRSIYATKQLRFPYGINGQSITNYINDITINGTDTVIRCALSDYVFENDTIENVTIASDWYATNNPNADVAVTNNSTIAFPKTIGKWTWPNYDRITGDTYTLRCVAFNRFGQNGSPVAAVQFWATDAHGHSVTNTVSRMSVDTAMGDAVPICEFIATMDASTFTQGDIITNNFRAFPWIGDDQSVLDTSDGVWTASDPFYAPLYYLADQTNAYGTVCAVVDADNGSAAGAALTTNLDPLSPPAAFASISQAARAIENTNALIYHHADVGGGIIYLRGSNAWTGVNGSPSNQRGKTWLTVTNFPGELAAISSKSGSGNINGLIKIAGLTINANNAFTFSGVSNLWFNACTFDVTNSSRDLVDGAGFHWATRCVVSNFDQGFLHQGSQNIVWAMVRGTSILGECPGSHSYCFIGNLRDATNRVATFLGTSLSGLPRPTQQLIVAYNKLLRSDYDSSTFLSFYNDTNCLDGAVFCQNLIESVNTNKGDALITIHGDSSSCDATNIMIFNNTIIGGKYNSAYDDLGSAPHETVLWREANNVIGDGNRKSDTFGGNSLDGNRIGNWPVLYGTGIQGDAWLEYSPGAPGNFLKEFAGLNSYQPPFTSLVQPRAGISNAFFFPAFVDDQSFNETTGVGDGDYHLTAASLVRFGVKTISMLPFDIEGALRTDSDPPGAYAVATLPPALSAHWDNGVLNFSFPTQVGITYILERNGDLANGQWQTFDMAFGDGIEQSISDTNSIPGQNFFRLRLTSP